jgi:aryl-alcohol dehydrogenase-like predicted oxidoreductase
MQRRALGNTGIDVSPLGLGTVKLGRNRGMKYPSAYDLPSDERAIELLTAARDAGINLIDTAPAYGTSEQRLGELLPHVAKREDWVIVTKAGEAFDGEQSTFDFSPKAITASVERSLTRLRTDYLDGVLLHSDGNDRDVIEESGGLGALESLKQQGKVRAIGASTKTPEGALLAAQRCDVVMLTLNPDHLADLPAIEAARERGVGVLIKKSLISGHIGAQHTPEACLTLALQTPGVSSAVVGTINPAHLRDNIATAERLLCH